jgi:hypothetical protein
VQVPTPIPPSPQAITKVDGATTGLKLQSSTTYLGALAVAAWVLAMACVVEDVPELARAAPPPPATMMPAVAKTATATRALVFILFASR